MNEAHNRIYDLLKADDGQAHKEARRYLEREAPELAAQLAAPALEAPAAPLDDSELEDLAHSANQECLSFGMSLDPFLRLAKTVRNRMLAAAPQAPSGVLGWVHPQWAVEQGRGRIYGHNPGGYVAVQIAAPQAHAAPVAYLALAAGGYMDLGTDLSEQQLGALPKGRHMLAIIGTYGIDGYVAAPAAPAVDAELLELTQSIVKYYKQHGGGVLPVHMENLDDLLNERAAQTKEPK